MPNIDPDAILRDRLGPDAFDVLRQLMEDYPGMLAVAVVVQKPDENLVVAAGGCTLLETAGLFQFGVLQTVRALETRGDSEDGLS